ncbi:MAG: tetratricopeptide repeat protein, partial [Sedimentisphaerales bacterium]
ARTVWDTGQVYRDLKKYEKANSLYQHVVENWPESEHAIQSQADLIKSNIALGDDVAAKAAVDKLLADFSEHPLIARTVWGTGQVYRDLKKYEKANQLYQHVINEWPGTEHAMWSQADLIKLYLALGDDPNAEAAADKLLADFNDSPLIARAVWDTGQVYRGLKKYKKANRLYQHVVENWPKPEHAMWAQADLIKSYLALGDDPNAEAAADKLLTDFNDSPLIARAVWDTARLYRDLKKYEKANQLYQHVIGDYPQAEHAILSQMGVAEVNVFSLIDFGNDTAAQEALDILIADFNDQPELPQTLLSISEQYFYRHNYKRATELWELMLSKYPGSSVIDEILYPLATCYERLKDHPNAIKYFTKLVEQYPNGQYAYRAPYKMALIYRRQEQYDQAIFWFQRQRQLYSKEPYGDRALYCEGLIYLNKLKDYRKAADIFQEYIETYPNGERLLAPYRLAVCYEEMGQRAQAIELLQQGLMEYSDTVYAETYMEKLMQLQ